MTDQTENAPLRPAPRAEIIVVGKGEGFAPGTLDYALGVAERLNAGVLAVSVNTLPEYNDDGASQRTGLRFASLSAASTEDARREARDKAMPFHHLCRKGKVSQVLSDLLHEHRHVSFVLVEKDIPLADVAQNLSVPVFTVNTADSRSSMPGKGFSIPEPRTFGIIPRNNEKKGVHAMATETSKQQARTKALLFGVLSAAIYGAVFANADLVMEYYTKGGFYNVLPVLTVFAVSYIHGSFASNVWTAIGINASRKVETSRKEAPARKTQRPRATVQA